MWVKARLGGVIVVATLTGVITHLVLLQPSVAAVVSCQGQPATVVGSSAGDRLVGTPGPDVIAGGGGADILIGLGGDDVLCGNAESDSLLGGAGSDALSGGPDEFESDRAGNFVYGDTLVPGPGDDIVDGGLDTRQLSDWGGYPDTLDYSAATTAVAVDIAAGTADGQGHDLLVSSQPWGVRGSPYDDVLTGGTFRDELSGAAGIDTIVGGPGDDELSGDPNPEQDSSSDSLAGQEGDDVLSTLAGADTLAGGPGRDSLWDSDNDADVLSGGPDGDFLNAWGRGQDIVQGGDGDDGMFDTIVAGNGQVVEGGVGNDSLRLDTYFVSNQTRQQPRGTIDLRTGTFEVEWPGATAGVIAEIETIAVPARWTAWGTEAPETFLGASDGPLTVHSGGGDDTLRGTVYADHLDGGDGADTAQPGKGDDTCVSVEVTGLPGGACDPTGVLGPASLVSLSPGGEQASSSPGGYEPAMSADGRFIAFQTPAALVAGDTNDAMDVYVRDTQQDRLFRVSLTNGDREVVQASGHPDISADGRFVVFESRGALTSGPEPDDPQIFVRDRRAGRTTLVSVSSRGTPADGRSFAPAISDDGRRIAFRSYAGNLGGGPYDSIYVRDRISDRTMLVSKRPDGRPTRAYIYNPQISGDGNSVVFATDGSGMAGRAGLVVRNLEKRTTEWVARPSPFRKEASISRSGRFIGFTRVDPDCQRRSWECMEVAVLDRQSGRVRDASVTWDGQRADASSFAPVLSGDGRTVLFTSSASNLVEGDDNLTDDVFLRDLRNGTTTLVTEDTDGPSGSPGEGRSGLALAADASWMAFESSATNLVDPDTNSMRDLFARSWQAP